MDSTTLNIHPNHFLSIHAMACLPAHAAKENASVKEFLQHCISVHASADDYASYKEGITIPMPDMINAHTPAAGLLREQTGYKVHSVPSTSGSTATISDSYSERPYATCSRST